MQKLQQVQDSITHVSKIVHHIYLQKLHPPKPFELAMFQNCEKSTRKNQIEAQGLFVLPVTRKGWLKKVEVLQKTVQTHCNNVRRQRLHDTITLSRTGYEALGAPDGFRNDEKEGCGLQRPAMKTCTRCNSNTYVCVCCGTAKKQDFGQRLSKTTWVGLHTNDIGGSGYSIGAAIDIAGRKFP